MGQCPACREWNTFVEEPVGKSSGSHGNASVRREQVPEPVKLSGISTENSPRTSSGMKELDRVLGGGIVPGSLVLVGGDPGIGKSTLLLQVCKKLAGEGKKILYISGEESLQQIKLRAERIGEAGEDMLLLCETDLDHIREVISRKSRIWQWWIPFRPCIIRRSVQAPGSVSQVREATGVADADCKRHGHHDFYCGSRDKGRRGGRTQSAGAYG